MKCRICGSGRADMIYCGRIRAGRLGQYTDGDMEIYQCRECNVIWHEDVTPDLKRYYESTEYRENLEGGSEEDRFYRLHDRETLEKFQYTGTDIFRHKVVADIGCGCGAFLDFVAGVADRIIAVEPSEVYRNILNRKGYYTYPYVDTAVSDYGTGTDIVTSFDVIEHVEEPEAFLKSVFQLLKSGGKAIIGTPTDAPVMRRLLGKTYEKKLLFSTQHLWIFSEKSMKIMAERCGYNGMEIKYFQRYGLDNALGWARDKEPNSEIELDSVTETMNGFWKSCLAEKGLGDYLVLYLQK